MRNPLRSKNKPHSAADFQRQTEYQESADKERNRRSSRYILEETDFQSKEIYPPQESDAEYDYLNQELNNNENLLENHSEINQENKLPRRAKYSPKVDRFLTNGIIIVGALLLAVLLIAFLV